MPLDGSTFRRPTPIADKMRELAGERGKNWCRGYAVDALGRMCLLGLLHQILPGGVEYSRAVTSLAEAVVSIDPRLLPLAKCNRDHAIGAFNDAADTTFPDILRVIDAFAEIEATEGVAVSA